MTEVLIVGGGPTGLMMACQLLRFGVSFRIIDKQADRSQESRAFGIQAKSMEIFQNLGIVDEFLEKSTQAAEINFFVNGKPKLNLQLSQIKIENTPFSTMFFLPQSETERILIECIEKQGCKIERSISLENFSQTNDAVNAVLKNDLTGETHAITCKYIIGCDGAHSTVRHVMGVPFIGAEYEQNFFLADAQVQWPSSLKPGFMLFLGDEGLFLHAPLNNGLSRIIGAQVSNPPPDPKSPLTLTEIENVAQKITHLKILVANPVWMTRFHLHHRVVKQYQTGRAFLAGDAAHIHSPVGGQGMNTGLQDAANLAWKIAIATKNNISDELLTTYQLERQAIGEKLTHTTDRFFWLLTSPNQILKSLRPLFLSLIMRLIASSSRIQRRLFWLMSELGIYYPQNKFVYEKTEGANAKFLAGPKAGFRAPDAPLGNGSLFEMLKGSPINILIFQNSNEFKDTLDKVQLMAEKYKNWIKFHPFSRSAETEIIFSRYGISTVGLYFIRPDGYIGFRDSKLDLDELLIYLNKIFG